MKKIGGLLLAFIIVPLTLFGVSSYRDKVVSFTDTTGIVGADSGDYSAQSIAGGDFNGDGYEDVIIGSFNADGIYNSGNAIGEAVIVYGGANIESISSIDLSNPQIPTTFLYGEDDTDHCGIEVAVGDFNNDGFDDAIIGANFASVSSTRLFAGKAYVVWGSQDLSSVPSIWFGEDNPRFTRILGKHYGDFLGSSLGAGDIDGDGIEDIIIGAPPACGPNGDGSGEIYIVYGDEELPEIREIDLILTTVTHTIIYGMHTDDHFGSSIDAGDINGDSYDDLIIGAEQASGLLKNSNRTEVCGEAYIIYGSPDIRNQFQMDMLTTSWPYTRIIGTDPHDQLGFACAAGDINGDGYYDAVVAAKWADGIDNNRMNCGEVFVLYGSESLFEEDVIEIESYDGDMTRVIGADEGDVAGHSILSADLDGDGTDELIVGVPAGSGPCNCNNLQGEAYVIYGSPFQPEVIDLSGRINFFVLWGEKAEDQFAWSLGYGDINGNGFFDLLSGAHAYGDSLAGLSLLGKTYVFYSEGEDYGNRRRFYRGGDSSPIEFASTRLELDINDPEGNPDWIDAEIMRGYHTQGLVPARWKVSSPGNPEGLESTQITIHYTAEEIAGMNLDSLAIYFRLDDSDSWTPLPSTIVPEHHRIYCLTSLFGEFSIGDQTIVGINEGNGDIPQLSLSQNYPNPMQGKTKIAFFIPHNYVHPKIKIYNIKGQLVKEIDIQNAKGKDNEVIWDGKDDNGVPVANGIYFYKLVVENPADGTVHNELPVHKLLLLRDN
jgi:hypothetical protein